MSPAGQIAPAVRTLVRFYGTGVVWWAGVFAVGLVPIGLAASYGEPDRSIWAYLTGEPVRWVLFVMGLLAAPSLFRVMVAHGITRRTFATASGIAIALFAVAVALYTMVGYLVERALYAVGDRPTTLKEPHLFESTGQVHLIFVEYALVAAAYLVSGWLIGVGFQRHWLVGIGFLPVAVLPPVVVQLALGTQPDGPWFPEEPDIDVPGLPLGVALLVAVGVVALGLLGGRGLLHSAPLRASKS